MTWCAPSLAAPNGAAPPADLLSFYDYPGPPANVSARLAATRARHLVYEVTWPSWVRTDYPANNQVIAYYYQPRRSGRVPAVVVLHSYGTRGAERERSLCGYLADRGIACLMPYLPYHWKRAPAGQISGRLMVSADLERTVQAVRQAIVDLRCGVDWLQQRPEVDPERIGVVGLSLGGILTHLAMGVDSRLSVGVSLLGGGRVADILWTSPLVRRVRAALEGRGVTLDHLRQRLRLIEPLTFAQLNRPRRVLMVGGRYDVVVPPRDTEAMWKALGQPPIVWLDTGHYGPDLVRSQMYELVSAYLLEQFGERRGSLPQVNEYTVKVGLLLEERFGVSATLNLTLADLGKDTFFDLALTSDGPLLGLSHMVVPGTELGLGLRLGKGRGRLRPYLGFVFVI